jgi:kumamolisin
VLRDITVGNNDTDGLLGGQYKAGPGWDACTGWGVPDGGKLLTALQGGPTS